MQAARVDRMVKGLDSGDPWLGLLQLGLLMSGKPRADRSITPTRRAGPGTPLSSSGRAGPLVFGALPTSYAVPAHEHLEIGALDADIRRLEVIVVYQLE